MDVLEYIFEGIDLKDTEGELIKTDNVTDWTIQFDILKSDYECFKIFFEQCDDDDIEEDESEDFIVIEMQKNENDDEDLAKKIYIKVDYENPYQTIKEINEIISNSKKL